MKYSRPWPEWNLGSPPDYLEWIFRFVQMVNPNMGIEIGLGPGGSTVAYLCACVGGLRTIDCHKLMDVRMRVLELTGAVHRWDYRIGRSHDVLPTLEEKYDYAYVDGEHDISAVHGDGFLIDKLLLPGGHIVFDDCGTYHAGLVNPGIMFFLESCPWYDEVQVDVGVINPNGPRVFRKHA